MLKTRIIPCLDVHDGRVVKGINFLELRDAGDPVEQAIRYDAQGADELCFLDIGATHENRVTLYELVERVASKCFLPLTVGGGVRELNDIRRLLNAGADKVSINSAAVKNPEFVRHAAQKFGNQCIVVAIDGKSVSGGEVQASQQLRSQETSPAMSPPSDVPSKKQNVSIGEQNIYEIFTHGGRNATGINAVQWAKKMASYGAGELLVTSMDRDGTKIGFDLPMTRAIADAVTIPIIASGGVGNAQHLVEGVTKGHASAVLAASIFHYGEVTIAQAKQAMHVAGVPVRL